MMIRSFYGLIPLSFLTLPGCFLLSHFFEEGGQFFASQHFLIFMLRRFGIQQFTDSLNERRRSICPPVVGKQFFEIVQFPHASKRQPQGRLFQSHVINGFPHRFRKLLERHVVICGITNDTFHLAFSRQIPPQAEFSKVDPILWTKKGHSLATLLPAFLTGNSC